MQSSLWKLGALLGVIGAGFLVLLKAQKEMTQQASTPEAFSELDAIDHLASLEETQATSTGEPASSMHAPDAQPDTPPDNADLPTYSATPTVVARTAAVDVEQNASVNPFATFAADESAGEADQAVSTADAENQASLESLEDLAALFGSEPSAQSDTDSAGESPAAAPPVDTFDPFPTLAADDPQANGDVMTGDIDSDPPPQDATGPAEEPLGIFPDESEPAHTGEPKGGFTFASLPQEEPPAEEEPAEESNVEPTPAETPLEPTLEQSEPEVLPPAETNGINSEPTRLSGLPETDEEPATIVPPEQDEEPSPTLALADLPNDADEVTGDPPHEITLASAEQFDEDESDPQPQLVFPGADDPPPSEPPPPAEFPDVSPEPAGRAWVGDSSPQIAGGEPTLADPESNKTIEMTIMPRNGEPKSGIPPQSTEGDLNPFGDGEDASAVADVPTTHEQPAPLERVVAPPAAEQPSFPDPGLSFSKGPIQPTSAEFPQQESHNDSQLTSADFVGVGTITPDTPSTPQQAQLTIEKQAPGNATLGQELIYSIVVRNVGRSAAKNVVVEDLVPKGTELQGTDPQARMTPEKKLIWQLGAMKPGATRTIRIKVIPTEAGQIGSVATVSFEAAVASRTVIVAPQLRLSMHGPEEVRVGEKAPYKFTLTNTGTADASNVYVRSIIPAGFEHPAAQKHDGVTDIEYQVGTLTRGESREVELTLLAVEAGQFQNHAILTADGNVNVESRQPVNVITSRLKIHREGPANRVVGSEARFINSVTNESGRPLQGVTVTEVIPIGLKFVQATDGGYYNAQRRTVTWQLETLEPGGLRRLQTVVLPESAGKMATKVTAVDQRGDEAQATSTLNVAGFSSLTVDVSNPARAIPVGEEVALRLKVRNGGTAAASKVETRVQLPPELKFVSAKGPVRYAQQGEWIAFEPIDRIGIQDEQTFDIVLAASSASQDARVVVQLTSSELTRPLSEDESVVIYADGP